MKKFICGFLAGAMIFGAIGTFAVSYVAEQASFKVMVNGSEFVSDKPIVAIDGSTYLPLKAIGEVLNVPVKWNDQLHQVEVGSSAPVAETSEYSRNNPAPINTMQMYTKTSDWFEEDNYTVAVRVMETIRGDAAYEALKTKSKLYPEPENGYEYMNIKLAFSVNKTKGDFSIDPSQYNFKVFSANNEESPANYYSSIDPVLEGALYQGGNTEGWITVLVKTDDKNPKLAYGLDYNGTGGIWFALQ